MSGEASAAFTDLVTGRECVLVLHPGRLPQVRHPGCIFPADVAVGLDAFYCRSCRWNGRVSGAWVRDMTMGSHPPE